MNIDTTAVAALAAAEGIALVAAEISSVPRLPPLNDFNGTEPASAPASINVTVGVGHVAAASLTLSSTAGAGAVPALAAASVDNTSGSPDDVPPDAPINADAFGTIVQGYVIEGLEDLAPHVKRHAIAFYNKLIPLFLEEGSRWLLIDREKYYKILTSLQQHQTGASLSSLRILYPNIHYWHQNYAVIDAGGMSDILVMRPSNMEAVQYDSNDLKRLTYIEKVFADLLVAHGPDHNKGRTFFGKIRESVSNVSRPVCKLFTDLCPRCIERHQRNRPTAGIRPIITNGFNVRGQVDLVDFQSMPDGEFRFLLNYIDHGIKILFSIPLVRKRASCIAIALFQIFTMIGPPMILQSDNGSEFHGAALNNR